MAALMQIAMPGQAQSAVGFDAPLALLAECHRRVERQCATLQRLVPHLQQAGSDTAAQEAATALLRYFGSAAVNHHTDEENDLFPALIESMAGSDAVCLRNLIQGLLAEHAELATRWRALQKALEQVAAGQPAVLDALAVREFEALYARHIACEEQELLPMAQRLLSDDALATIGQAMRERRALPP